MKMLVFSLLFSLLFLSYSSLAQEAFWIKQTPIPLLESSGLVVLSDGRIITHNDSGNPATIFLFEANGNLIREIKLSVSNVDWESVAIDENENFLYIADIGNNENTRQDLKIYRFFLSDLLNGKTDNFNEIVFSYPEQTGFPPAKNAQYFDAEALFEHDHNLYIITKNRTSPFDGHALVYQIPSKPGKYQANLVDTVTFSPGAIPYHWVTDVDKLKGEKQLAILLGSTIQLALNYPNQQISKGAIIEIDLPISRQFEGIAWVNDSTLLLSCESSKLGSAAFFWLSISEPLNNYKKERKHEIKISEKQFKDTLWVELNAQIEARLYYEFYSTSGDRISTGTLGPFEKGNHKIPIIPNSEIIRNGNYMVNIQYDKLPHGFFVYRFDPEDARKGIEELKKELQQK